MKKEYVVFSMSLAGYLMMNRNVLKRIEETEKTDSRRNVFIFNETEKLLEDIKTYKKLYAKTSK